eukprot:8443492-Pyramimonas_sp.AAC.1
MAVNIANGQLRLQACATSPIRPYSRSYNGCAHVTTAETTRGTTWPCELTTQHNHPQRICNPTYARGDDHVIPPPA